MLSVASAPATLKAAPAVNAGNLPSPVVPPATGFGVASSTQVNAPQMTAVPETVAGTGSESADKSETKASSANSSSSVSSQRNTENASNTRKLTKKEKMRKIIEDNYQMRKSRLEAALEKASLSLRPAYSGKQSLIRKVSIGSQSKIWIRFQTRILVNIKTTRRIKDRIFGP